MGQKNTGWFRSDSGIRWEMDLPLKPEFQNQLLKGQLVRVNEDGSAWVEPKPEVVAEPVETPSGHTPTTTEGTATPVGGGSDEANADGVVVKEPIPSPQVPPNAAELGLENIPTPNEPALQRPTVADKKEVWVAYAKSQGLEDADDYKKEDLVNLYKE